MMLALKFNKNNHYPLYKEYLDITTNIDDLSSLEGIDNFTAKFSKDEIINSVRRSNIIANEEMLEIAKLVIIYKDKEEDKNIREFKVYTNEDIDYLNFETIEYLFRNISNKNILNRLNNHFTNKNYLDEDLINFASILNNISVGQLINSYMKLSYKSIRILKDYIYEEMLIKEEEKVLKRDSKEIQ